MFFGSEGKFNVHDQLDAYRMERPIMSFRSPFWRRPSKWWADAYEPRHGVPPPSCRGLALDRLGGASVSVKLLRASE